MMCDSSYEPETIVVIEKDDDCIIAIENLKRHCDDSGMLGLDCESDENKTVSLLQMCAPSGYCVLIRLCFLPQIPQILRNLLSDRNVIKVGVGAPRDAARLYSDHFIATKGILDLRFPAALAGYKSQNLADMYKEVLGKTLIRTKYPCSWECPELSWRQKKYAAQGAFAGIEIYKKLIETKIEPSELIIYYNTTFDPHKHNHLRSPRTDMTSDSYRPPLAQGDDADNSSWKIALGVGVVGVAAFSMYKLFNNSYETENSSEAELPELQIESHIIEDIDKCNEAVSQLRRRCHVSKVLGFDCEGNQNDKKALLQLCSHSGYCVLIRLSHLPRIPRSLRDLLMDRNIVKVGVGAQQDAESLFREYAIVMESVLDLRFLAALTGYKPQNLPSMYKEVTGKNLMDKKYAGSWSSDPLRDRHISYAASDAYAGVEIYMKLIQKMHNPPELTAYYNKNYNPNQHNVLQSRDDECILQ